MSLVPTRQDRRGDGLTMANELPGRMCRFCGSTEHQVERREDTIAGAEVLTAPCVPKGRIYFMHPDDVERNRRDG